MCQKMGVGVYYGYEKFHIIQKAYGAMTKSHLNFEHSLHQYMYNQSNLSNVCKVYVNM